MSWSVSATGRPAAVKAALAKQFESAKENTANIPHECRSVESVEQLVNDQLDFLSALPGKAVAVSANGSVWTSKDADGKVIDGGTNVSASVSQIGGWVE